MHVSLPKVIRLIQQNLTPDLLRGKPEKDHPYAGHCYVASEALYHLFGKNVGYHPHRAKDQHGVNHYWLQHKDGHILDVTEDQYLHCGEKPPHKDGRRCAFLTKEPCARTRALLINMRLNTDHR